MGKILLVGEDFSLLATRAAVLENTGADVVPCSPLELGMHLGQERFDLVVLCHTLGGTARQAVTAEARRRWPEVRLLQVVSTLGEMSLRESGLDGMTTTEPDQLVVRAMELLGRVRDGRSRPLAPPSSKSQVYATD